MTGYLEYMQQEMERIKAEVTSARRAADRAYKTWREQSVRLKTKQAELALVVRHIEQFCEFSRNAQEDSGSRRVPGSAADKAQRVLRASGIAMPLTDILKAANEPDDEITRNRYRAALSQLVKEQFVLRPETGKFVIASPPIAPPIDIPEPEFDPEDSDESEDESFETEEPDEYDLSDLGPPLDSQP